jgi:phosphohistidine phosphatase SixA/ADP-ribose pyrophosphatase YjhB (NUDIX family)
VSTVSPADPTVTDPGPVTPSLVVPAAGTVPWRRRRGRLEVALVHRPKYDDWSWAKGKLDPGEEWPVAAARETQEETGLRVHLGRPLPPAGYTVLDRTGEPATKRVRYWAAEVVGGQGRLVNEIDEVRWLDVVAAHDRLDYARDREQLRAVVRADAAGQLTTWPLVVVRHAKARPRRSWKRPDPERPLDERGQERAQALIPLLAAYGVTRLVSSSSTRCADTLRPYAAAAGLSLRLRDGLSEEGFEADPARSAHHLRRLVERGAPAAVCSHGPVIPSLLSWLEARVDPRLDGEPALSTMSDMLAAAADDAMDKGEVLVCHLVGTGDDTRMVAVERHRP